MKKRNILDGHCDTAVELWKNRGELADNPGQVSLRRAGALGGYVQFFAFCTCWQDGPERAADHYRAALPFFLRQLERNRARIALLRGPEEAALTLSDGRCGAFLSIEGAESLDCDPGLLEGAWADGIRMITLTWNYRNALAGSCLTGEGLSGQGREFVRRAQKLGIALDVSHLSDRAFWDLCEISEKPIVASHSNARAVCPCGRNLTDEQFRAICSLGGTAGINLYSRFLSDGPATFDDVRRHIEHFLELGGEGHIALGADLDGCDELPEGFAGLDSYPALLEYLGARGLREDTLDSISSGALLETLRKCG